MKPIDPNSLDDARAAVDRSDRAQLGRADTSPMATRGETLALRDAVRALIQEVEYLRGRVSS